jgi:siderophore synthetase component
VSTRGSLRQAGPTDVAAARLADALASGPADGAGLAEPMLAALPAARDVVNRRLVGAAHREHLVGSPDEVVWADQTAFLPLADGGVLVTQARAHGFDRVEVDEPLSADPALLLERLTGRADPTTRAVGAELTDATVNLALAYARRARPLEPPAAPGVEDADAYARFLESYAIEGHNLHPCGRTRLGWSAADLLAYDLEADAMSVAFVAVRRDHHIGDEIGPQFLPESTVDPRRYAVTPVHPWQLRRLLDRYPDGDLFIPLEASWPAAPTAALRTLLLPPDAPARYLKVSLDIQVTSTRRTISVASTRNGPLLSRLLAERIDSDRVLLMAETAGSAARLPSGERDLSAIARAGLTGRLEPGEIAVPGSALTAVIPGAGSDSVLVDLVDRFATTRGFGPRAAAAAFTREYAALLLPPLLRLATRHGIGIEAHLQNCVPTFVDGVPHRLALRDFAGLRIYPDRLRDAPPLWPASVVRTGSLDTMRAKIAYTALQAHLGEVIRHLVDGYDLDEAAAWSRVREVVDETYDGLRADPAIAVRAAGDHAFLTAPTVPHKALLSMRLSGRPGDLYVPVGNPLR